jgi:hypothetical protein
MGLASISDQALQKKIQHSEKWVCAVLKESLPAIKPSAGEKLRNKNRDFMPVDGSK